MPYKTGEVPQLKDEVMGVVEGKPARGRVLGLRDDGSVLVTRRAPYVEGKPLTAEHLEVPSGDLSLVYRPRQAGSASKAPAAKAKAAPAKKEVKKP